jgi:DNA-binding CsgD family transcriptional regulator
MALENHISTVSISRNQFISGIEELTEFITKQNPSLDHLCEFLTNIVLAPIHIRSLFIYFVRKDGVLERVGTHGFSEQNNNDWAKVSMSDTLPVTDAIRNQNIVWLGSREELYEEYPILKTFPKEDGAHCFISVPITLAGAPLSVIGMAGSHEMAPEHNYLSYLDVICRISALHLSSIMHFQQTSNEHDKIHFLSERQLKILELMSRSLTNIEISRALGLSESTIRQETMRIYHLLTVPGRKSAIRKYKEYELTTR